MRRNRLAVLTMALAMTLSFAMPAMAETGWVYNGSVWNYYHADGHMGRTQWIKNGDSMFWLKDDGAMAVSEWIKEGETWYWLDGSGCAATGWVEIDGKWYYFFEDHHMASNETINSRYVGKDGAWDTSR